MPIRIELAPGEKLYIGKSVLVNGRFRSEFILEGRQPILRSKDHMQPDSIKSDLDRLYYCIQQMYLEEAPSVYAASYRYICEQLAQDDRRIGLLGEMERLLQVGQHFKALRKLKTVIGADADLSIYKACG